MPKLKTHRGAYKRFRTTHSGKIKFKRAGLRHLLSGTSRKKKRQLRKAGILADSNWKKIVKTYIPYGH